MTDAPVAARAAWAGSDALAATPCAPSGARPARLTARTLWPVRTSSATTAPPIAPVAPKTTCNEPPGSAIVMLLPLAPIVPGAEYPRRGPGGSSGGQDMDGVVEVGAPRGLGCGQDGGG